MTRQGVWGWRPTRRLRMAACGALAWLAANAAEAEGPSREDAAKALRRAVEFFRTTVSAGGSYCPDRQPARSWPHRYSRVMVAPEASEMVSRIRFQRS